MRGWWLVALACWGCAHRHFEWNAPGRVEVEAPPEQIERREVTRPDDPGERLVLTSAGPMALGGLAFGQGPAQGGYALGVEASVQYGDRERSHFDDDFFISPRESLGLNVGWVPLTQRGSGWAGGYLEGQYMKEGLGFALGYALSAGDGAGGPQLTAFYGPFFVRMSYYLGRGVDAGAGVCVKLPYAWVWSR